MMQPKRKQGDFIAKGVDVTSIKSTINSGSSRKMRQDESRITSFLQNDTCDINSFRSSGLSGFRLKS